MPGPAAPPGPGAAPGFDYDSSAPLDVREVSVSNVGEARRLHDISYAGYRGGRVTAYLLERTGEGPRPGLLFLHRASGDRSVYLAEAMVLARAGAICLLIDAPQARPAPWRKPLDVTEPDSLRELFVQTVVDLRRGIDLLCARPDVDRARIGFVGQRFGANVGALLLASDARVKVASLQCMDPSWTSTLRTSRSPGATGLRRALPADRFKRLIEAMAPLDAGAHLGRTHAKLLLQYARYDNELASAADGRLAGSAGAVRWYEAGRELDDLEALVDRVNWIEEALELRFVPASRAARERPGPEAPPADTVSAKVEDFARLVKLHDYDARVPLEFKTDSARTLPSGIRIESVSYASPKGGRVTALLVHPPGTGPFGGVLFMHPGAGDRSSFLPEAIALAEAGAVSLLPEAPFARPAPWTRRYDPADSTNDRDLEIQNVVDLRRGIDLLCARPDVDKSRLGYVGHSYGAVHGGVLAGVDHRLRAFVLMGGEATPAADLRDTTLEASRTFRAGLSAEQLDRYVGAMEPLDPVHYIGHAVPAALLFQFARFDVFIDERHALEYAAAASQPKQVRWYDTGHDLFSPDAVADRLEWLGLRLRLQSMKPIIDRRLGVKRGGSSLP